jgi:hypothetical protein
MQQQQQQQQQHLEVLQALPQTIQHAVRQEISAHAVLPDVALADCGGRIVSCTPINISALQQQLRPAPAHVNNQHSAGQLGKAAMSVLQQLQRSLGHRMPTSTHAGAVSGGSAPGIHTGPAAASSTHSSTATRHWQQEQQLLHRVLLRPASDLLPVACIPLLFGPDGSPAVIEVQLPQPAYIHNVAMHATGIATQQVAESPMAANSASSMHAAEGLPEQVTLVLANSSSCGGPAVSCTLARSTEQGALFGPTQVPGSASAEFDQDFVVPHPGLSSNNSSAGSHASGSVPTADAAAEALLAVDPADVLRPGVAAAVLQLSPSFVSGRAVLPVCEEGSCWGPTDAQGNRAVLADRVLLVVPAGPKAAGPCMGRISVYGRPINPATFC